MKRWLLAIIIVCLVIGLALLACSQLFKKRQPAALKIISEPRATIFLEGKHLGQTPFEDKNLKPGEFALKLVPELEGLPSFEQKIKLNPGVLTAVNYKFGESEEFSNGAILTLEPLQNKKLISLAIISTPDGALVKVDGITRGFTPISLEDISEGDHLISLSIPGYLEKEIKAKTILGHKLIINTKLAREKIEKKEATPSAEKEEPEKPYIIINETPTGWLRVRLGPTTAATEAAKVKPGEKYPLLEEEKGWYKIRYSEGKEGWVSGKYATKYE